MVTIMHDLERLRKRSEAVAQYLSSVGKEAPAFTRQLEMYEVNKEVIEELREYADAVVVIVFSAEWCPDCHKNVPILGLVAEATGLEVRVFGHLMRDTQNSDEIWRIPPSPREVKEFNVTRIPKIIVLTKEGEKIGEIDENPPKGQSLEEAMLCIIKKLRS